MLSLSHYQNPNGSSSELTIKFICLPESFSLITVCSQQLSLRAAASDLQHAHHAVLAVEAVGAVCLSVETPADDTLRENDFSVL